jgi:hypothetical protein
MESTTTASTVTGVPDCTRCVRNHGEASKKPFQASPAGSHREWTLASKFCSAKGFPSVAACSHMDETVFALETADSKRCRLSEFRALRLVGSAMQGPGDPDKDCRRAAPLGANGAGSVVACLPARVIFNSKPTPAVDPGCLRTGSTTDSRAPGLMKASKTRLGCLLGGRVSDGSAPRCRGQGLAEVGRANDPLTSKCDTAR